MMPSTETTAILLCASLSLSRHSSSRGPTSCVMPVVKLRLKFNMCEMNWVKLMSRLNISTTSKMIAKIIQPRLLRGLSGGGGVMTGGGGEANGGGTPGESKDEVSIAHPN